MWYLVTTNKKKIFFEWANTYFIEEYTITSLITLISRQERRFLFSSSGSISSFNFNSGKFVRMEVFLERNQTHGDGYWNQSIFSAPATRNTLPYGAVTRCYISFGARFF